MLQPARGWVSTALFPEIRSNRMNANGTSLALSYARVALNKLGDRFGQDHGFRPLLDASRSGPGIRGTRSAHDDDQEDSRQAESRSLLRGRDNFKIAGVPIRKHFSWDKRRINFLVMDTWGRAEMHPAGFYEVDNRKIFEIRGASGGVATSQIFYTVASFNIYNSNPAASSYMNNLAVPAGMNVSWQSLTMPQAVLIVGLVFAWLIFVIARAIGEKSWILSS